MKLQLTPDALRLRLSEAEVQAFAQAGQLTHTLPFGPGQVLRYTLRRLPTADLATNLQASYLAGELVVSVPAALAHTWTSTGNIALKGAILTSENQQLRILVEKDLGPSH